MFNVTVGDKTRKFMSLLGIKSYPFTESEIKSKFREKVKANHSDRIGGDDSLAKKLIEAYSHMKYLAIGDTEIADKGRATLKAERESKDMFELFDKCPLCKGEGEIVTRSPSRFEDCDKCSVRLSPGIFGFSTYVSIRTITVACKACKGTGKFKQRSRVVVCYKCLGRKKITIICPKCKGHRVIFTEACMFKNKCLKCGGSGRVRINPFNPVIPKGAVL